MTSQVACMALLALICAALLHTVTAHEDSRFPAQLRSSLSTAPCRVGGERMIPHGQQIEREDPCEFCICIDSNVFCWWGQQHCANNATSDNSTDADANMTSWSDTSESTDATNVTEPTLVTTAATSCVVMGRQYSLGAVLPRDTGTCLECVCGKGGRVTCSPKDCIRPNDDFHNSDPNNSLDMFDVDVF